MVAIGLGGVSVWSSSAYNKFGSKNPLTLDALECSTWRYGTGRRRVIRIIAMASKKKVNKYDPGWKKEWFGAGIFLEGSEEVEVDVLKKVEQRKLLSNVEKSGLLSKAQGAGLTLSSIEKLGVLSKAEQFGLLSLLENYVSLSPAALASSSLPFFLASIAAFLLIPHDSFPLAAAQAAVSATLLLASVAFFLSSLLLEALQQEQD